MSLFDELVTEAIRSRPDLATLRPVVEKELLHHDILREMAEAKMLSDLTFIGGTCLRACYGSERLSEDLDFTGGSDFRKEQLAQLGEIMTDRLQTRYGLSVNVSDPVETGGTVSTWKMRIETRPEQRHLPAQRIHIDICAIPSHDPRPTMLRNIYEVDMGTSGLIVRAQSREEILADKLIAFAFRENRIKNRDIWDIGWLTRKGIEFRPEWIPEKIADHGWDPDDFRESYQTRLELLGTDPKQEEEFRKEMSRFLPASLVRESIANADFWVYLRGVLAEQGKLAMLSIR